MVEVHVTFPDLAEASEISRAAVEKRLAACANIAPPIRSIYWWDGKVQSEAEVAVVFKTTDAQADALIAFVAERHSYAVPAITVHRPLRVHPPYEQWVARETAAR